MSTTQSGNAWLYHHDGCSNRYTGNSPVAKPDNYGSRAIGWEEFRALVAGEIARHNARPSRRAAVCAGRSFDQTHAEAAEGAVIGKAGARQLRLFQLASDNVPARPPSGEVHLGGNRYWAEPLVELAGKDVVLRFDPEDLHGGVIVETLDGTELCAAECIEDTGFNDAEAAARDARKKAEYMRRVRAGLDAERRLTPAQVAKLLPDAPAPAPVPEPAPVPQPAAVRLVQTPGGAAIKERRAAEEAQGAEERRRWDAASSNAVDMLERAEIRFPSPWDQGGALISRTAATAGRG